VCGVAGFAAAIVTATGLLAAHGFPMTTVVYVTVGGLGAFVLLGLVQKAVLGRERHALWEGVIAVLVVDAGLARAVGQPVLRLLDAVMVALGVLLVFARWGCLLQGCCHGRPAAAGVVYVQGLHADDPLTGVRLFPLPLIDGLALVVVTAIAAAMNLSGARDGEPLLFWLTGYAVLRFGLDFARGTLTKMGPLSESQWFAVLVVIGRIGYDQVRQPDRVGAVAAALALLICLLGFLTRRSWLAVHAPTSSHGEVALWQRQLAAPSGEQDLLLAGWTVSLRVNIFPPEDDEQLHAYALRSDDPSITLLAAAIVLQRLPEHRLLRAAACDHGQFHLWVAVREGPLGSTVDDDPALVLLRARAAAIEIAAHQRARVTGHERAPSLRT
jgi:hypothetical protein